MPEKNTVAPEVVVIGGSEGSIEGLLELVPKLPPNLPAAVCIVVHVPVDADSYLPRLLERRGQLPVEHPRDKQPLRAGRVYIAPPNYHLTLEDHTARVSKGPRENRHRPAIDPLFRSAARVFRRGVIGVLLSGNLDDGAAGILAVRSRGGIAIVQDPSDARVPEMPRRALDYAGADFILPLDQIASKIVELTRSPKVVMKKTKRSAPSDAEVRQNEEVTDADEGNGKPSVFACPECHGVLWQVEERNMARYRCRVGHAFTEKTLHTELDEASERALWAAMRALEEKAAMTRRMIEASNGPKTFTDRLKDQAKGDLDNARVIRKIIFASD